ncbi:IclR family transcriptional regulator [Gordonia sp. CPCC 205515]|uniref:IclR family transcriptional regulator n=1 Tax=Gordonia sp. CPCC 205515 TaxID=3140791 RepID=UPI003AF3EC3C
MSSPQKQRDSASSMASNRSVIRAVHVLRTLGASSRPMTATEVAQTMGLPRATTFRLLLTLEEEGFVEREDTRYSLGWDLARLAGGIDPATRLAPRVDGVIGDLAEELGETVTLSLRRGRFDLDLVVQANPRRVGMSVTDLPGQRWPLHASATGKLLLSELADDELIDATSGRLEALTERTITNYVDLRNELQTTRERGWAITDEELEEGIFSVAVPIRDSSGGLLAALSYVAPVHRIDDEKQAELTRRLIDGAERVRSHLNTAGALSD